jgi:hypothetical protein
MTWREEQKELVAGWAESLCMQCGGAFPQRGGYETLCPVCYKGSKSYKLLWGDQAFLWLQGKLETETQKRVEAEHELQRAKEVLEEERKDGFSLQGKLLRALIALCHPDRHNNSKKATAVTRRLLRMREREKR